MDAKTGELSRLNGEKIRPIRRSGLRIILGKAFYTAKTYLDWYFGKTKFACTTSQNLLPYLCFQHSTPLLRKLKELEMWMQYNKTINLRLAVRRLDGIILNPGETFSYWRLIGKPTKSKGYVEGMVLFCGEIYPGVGGGLCQLSNLIYWLTLHTPLTVTERYRHSYDVFPDTNRTQPFGSGATCVYNYRDLKIYNGTTQPYQLHVYLTKDQLVGEWRSIMPQGYLYEVYEKEHRITHEYWGDYVRHNLIYRKIYTLEGQLIDDQYVTENHAIMLYQPFLTG